MFLIILLYAILASTFIFAKEALQYAQPCFLIAFRMILAGTILLGYQWVMHRKDFVFKREDYGLFIKVGFFHIFLAFVPEFWALQYVSALKTTIIYSSTPFIAALLAYFLLSERLSSRKFLGIAIGLGGLTPVLMSQLSDHVSGQSGQIVSDIAHVSLAEIVLFFAVASSAYAWFLVKKLMHKGYNLGTINGVAMFIGGIMSLITASIFEGFSAPVSNWHMFLFWVGLLIITANIVVYNFYGFLLKRYSITFLSFAGFLCPCFGTLYDWLFMGGHVTSSYFISLGLITLGLYIFYRDELSQVSSS